MQMCLLAAALSLPLCHDGFTTSPQLHPASQLAFDGSPPTSCGTSVSSLIMMGEGAS